MKNVKVTLAWVLSIVATIGMGFLFFGSHYFQSEGDLKVAIIWTGGIVVAMIAVVAILQKVKKIDVLYSFKTYAIIELCLLVVYIGLGVFSIFQVNHFYTVLGRQTEVSTEIDNQLSQLTDMYTSYNANVDERLDIYRHELVEGLENKKRGGYDYPRVLDSASVEAIITSVSNDISCSKTQDVMNKWQDTVRNSMSKLHMFSLMTQVNEVSEKLEKERQHLVALDKCRSEGCNDHYWEYSLDVNTDIQSKFTDKSSKIEIWSIISAFLLMVLALFPYIFEYRDDRHSGLFHELISKDSENDGEVYI